MTLKYLASKILDYNSSSKDVLVSSGENGTYFRSINFSKTFFTETPDKFSTSVTLDADLGNLTYAKAACSDANCSACSDIECYTCKTGYYLEAGICKNTTGSQLYFLSPGYSGTLPNLTKADITLTGVTITKMFSLSFFMKFFSRSVSSTNIDVFRITPKLKLRLKFGSSQAKLQLYSDVSGVKCVIGEYTNYISRFGVWTHIAISFYYEYTKLNYYPANMNFQVNFTPVAAIPSCYNKQLDLGVSLTYVFPKESIALYASVLTWDKYFTGIWGYQAHKDDAKQPTTSKLVDACITEATKTINCYRDYTSFLLKTAYCTDPTFYDGSTCITKQATCPYGYFTNSSSSKYCSCQNLEKKTWIVSKNDNMHYCKSNKVFFYFINF